MKCHPSLCFLLTSLCPDPIGSLSNSFLERGTSTGSCFFFAPLSRDFEQIFGQIVSIRVKTLSNTNLVASRHIKKEKRSLPVDMRRSKTSLEYLNAWNRLDKGLSIQPERNGIREGLGCVSAFGLVEVKKVAEDFTRLTKTK